MPVESAADRAAFFNADEFGVSGVYSHASADTAITGLFDRPFVTAADDEGGFGVGDRAPSFQCAESSLPAGAGEDDTLVVTSAPMTPDIVGIVWKVAGAIERDGTGMATLRLEKAT